jgi:hypothetical protein
LDTPHDVVIEISSSSYNLLLFSQKASSDHDGGAGASPRESSSVSIGDLWPEIDSSHDADYEGAFATTKHSHSEASTSRLVSYAGGLKEKIKERVRDVAKGAALEQALGRSSAPKKGCGGSSAKGKAG